ncbi:MAG: GNVR domain-containing protein [Candidatus Acidiferrales bacterium]
MLGHRAMNVKDYLDIIRRRIWAFMIPLVVIPVAAILVGRVLPKRYTATTTVLVGQQRIQESLVNGKPVVANDVNQRIATIQQQILSRPSLEVIINRYNLFAKQRSTVPIEDLEDALAKQIEIAPVQALPGSDYRGDPGFSISVTAGSAELAQKVCTDITDMFTHSNTLQIQNRAKNTTDFLGQQLADAKTSLDSQDARLAEFKRRYLGQLPDETQANLGMLQSLTTQLSAVAADLNRAQQDRAFTETLLEQQIASLQTTSDSPTNPDTLQKQLSDAEALLATLQSKYTDDHPDVIKAKHDITVLKQKIAQANQAAQANPPQKAPSQEPVTSPEVQQLRAQLHQYDEVIRQKSVDQKRIQDQIQMYQTRVNMSPLVEQEYKEITRDYQNASDFYNDLLTKKSQSTVDTHLQEEDGGEQFQVVDPAELPQRPTFPKLTYFAAGGLAGGFAIGVALVLLLEMSDKSLRCEQDVEVLLRIPMLAQMPIIDASTGKNFRRGPSVSEQGGINLTA